MHRYYYFDITNRLLSALNSDDKGSVVVARLMRLACEGLRQVAVDLEPGGDLAWSIEHLRDVQSSPAAFAENLHDLRSATGLVEIFLHKEFGALEADGVPAPVKSLIQSQAREVLTSMKYVELPNVDHLRSRMNNIVGSVCSQAKLLENREAELGIVKKATYVLGGGGLITFNGSVDIITTFGLAPWMTVLSGAVGGGIMTRGL